MISARSRVKPLEMQGKHELVSKDKAKKTLKKAKAPSPGDENGFNALITVGAGPGPNAPKRPQHGSAVTMSATAGPGRP